MRTILLLLGALLAGCSETSTPTLSAGNTATEDAHLDAAQLDDASARRSDLGSTESADTPDAAEADAPACACDDGNPCTIDICLTDGTCDTDLPPAGTACPGGLCLAGECVAPDAAVAEVADSGAAADAGDAEVVADTVDAGPVPDASDAGDTADAAEAGAEIQPDIAADVQADAALPPDAAAQADAVAEVAQGDTQAGDAGQAPPDAANDASAGDADAQAQGDAVGTADVAPDANPDAGQVCGCPGDNVALMGDCSLPGSVQLVGKVGAVAGVAGGGYHFDTAEQTPPRTSGLHLANADLTGDFTFQAWVRLAGYDLKRVAIATSENGMGVAQGFNLYAHTDQTATQNGVGLFLCTAPFSCSKAWGPQLPMNAWAHVAVVRKAGVVRLFVQGQPVADMPFAGDLADTQAGLWVGSSWPQMANGHDMAGDLDDVRVAKKALFWDAFTPLPVCGL